MDWNRARAFLATAEAGSLSAAARRLGLTQPTLGRQVAALETELGVVLFERTGRALSLTPAGADLLVHVREMGLAAERMALVASGRSAAAEGPVSVSASDILSAWLLPGLVRDLGDVAPGIRLEIVASNEISDLQRREADIAVRHVRPDAPELVARHLGDGTAHLWGAVALIDRLGRPVTRAAVDAAPFVGFTTVERMVAEYARIGLPLTADRVKGISTSGIVAWEMVRAGVGLTPMSDEVGRLTPGVEQVPAEVFAPVRFPFWLTAHREVRTSRRVRIVYDFLAERLSRVLRG